ncbi:MAG: BMP family ABC transporter substrate-binding protein [Spirochaetes bacterium]|jgi:basic membrane protein A|nr:BMP family ABC transporter substrate-binding protein [Spirochaetota bacterium]
MYNETTVEIYRSAVKSAKTNFMKRVSDGGSGYLPALDGLINHTDIVSENNIGTFEIPLKKIIGTSSHSRATAFSRNFYPIQELNTEFAGKWMTLFESHLAEGIRDSISVYEYLNWFYVREGNKRVSVLKFNKAYSINAEVRRIIPKRDPSDMTNTIYYEFLEFNKITHIFTIWFSRPGRFPRLLEHLSKYKPKLLINVNKYQSFFSNIYMPFSRIFHDLDGDRIDITTADALLQFLDLYGIPDEITESKHRVLIKKLFPEFETLNSNEVNEITEPARQGCSNVINQIAKRMTNKKLKIGFIYAKSAETSGWTNSQEQGRQHIISMLGSKVETVLIDDVPQDETAYDYICKLADKKLDVIFTTSPTFKNATLKAAIEYPKIKFFNCSGEDSSKNVRSFFGRIHEVRFLMGILAGSLTKSDKIGYVASYPIPEVISSINAFAMGAAMVNPRAKVYVRWMYRWENESLSFQGAQELSEMGVDLISQDDLPILKSKKKAYGLFSTKKDEATGQYEPFKHYAIPIWHWGVFYEKIITNILNDTWKLFFEGGKTDSRPVNFWWGINSGLVDIFYSTTLVSRENQKFIEFMRKMIIQDEFSIFEGPVFDRDGIIRIPDGESGSRSHIVKMNWFVQNVEGDIPILDKTEIHDPLTEQFNAGSPD